MLTAPKRILPTLVLAQFAGTSLWFAVNAVMPDLQQQMGWPASAVGRLTSALQLGFIVGTLVFALLAIADRFSARRVFLFCALAGALCTLGAMMRIASFTELLYAPAHSSLLPPCGGKKQPRNTASVAANLGPDGIKPTEAKKSSMNAE